MSKTQNSTPSSSVVNQSGSNGSTGPKTPEGKAIAAKNAMKKGIFSKAYLPWEDQEAKQAEFDSLVKEWGVNSATGVQFLRDIEQATLAQERLMYAQRLIVEGVMQSAQVGFEFAEQANIDVGLGRQLPSWYFLQDDEGNKAQALLLDQVYEQAEHLRAHYSDQLVAQAKTRYPQLYEYVMDGYTPTSSFVMVLGKEYKQSAPTLNLAALMNALHDKFRYHLLWARDAQRYQIMIDGLRAEKMVEVLDFDKSNRYLTNFQNRKIRAIQGLELLERRNETKRLASTIITVQPALSKPPATDLDPKDKELPIDG